MQTTTTPPRVLGLYDIPFWEKMRDENAMKLQCCSDCGAWRYPPGPICRECLSPNSEWKPVSGGGELLSWVRFHKQYLPAYPAPYNVIAVRLDEGPTIISNLVGEEGGKHLIGRRVQLQLDRMDDGVVLPRFVLAKQG